MARLTALTSATLWGLVSVDWLVEKLVWATAGRMAHYWERPTGYSLGFGLAMEQAMR